MKFHFPSSDNVSGKHTGEHSENQCESRFLNPGDFYFCGPNCQLHTLLGSCIAITLWHPVLHVGGMCHFVLHGSASGGHSQKGDSAGLNGRYLDDAMALFEIEARRRSTHLDEYQAKVFGGSNTLSNSTLDESELIGTKNAEAALKQLSDRGVSILVTSVGESGHRRIVFDVESGDVWVKHEPLLQIDS